MIERRNYWFTANVAKGEKKGGISWLTKIGGGGGSIKVFYATFNNISAISCWSVLLLEEIKVPGKNHRPAASN